MNIWTLAELTAQVTKNSSVDKNLVFTKEFELLVNYLYQPETILHLLVCGLEGVPHLVVLTTRRIFFIQKSEWNGAKVIQFGLEEILDLETQESSLNTNLIFTFTSNLKSKLTNISTKVAYSFGQAVVGAVKNWKQEII